MEKTAVDVFFEKIRKNVFTDRFCSITDIEEYYKQAKEIEKQQIIDSFELWRTGSGEQYYNETYGSKGSDEHIVDTNEMIFDQELFNYFSQEFNISLLGTEIQDIIYIVKKHTSSQTEISDEEIQQGIADKWDGYVPSTWFSAFEEGAKWYREQLKKNNNLKLK